MRFDRTDLSFSTISLFRVIFIFIFHSIYNYRKLQFPLVCVVQKLIHKNQSMAGMLPGVESARRRRFYSQGESASSMANSPNSTRRSLSLYSTKHDSLLSSSSSLQVGTNRSISSFFLSVLFTILIFCRELLLGLFFNLILFVHSNLNSKEEASYTGHAQMMRSWKKPPEKPKRDWMRDYEP